MSDVGEIAVNKLIELNNMLCDLFVQREFEILGALTGLLTNEPVIFVGMPGTAKTQLIETIARAINCRYFYYLLTRFTEPDELLGPLDINALKQGRYARITENRLPTAEIVFLDEIFKGSSAIRNILLDIILNKRYLNGTEYKELPMLAFYSASNEVSTDVEDMAFYDRLLIRNFVKNVSDDRWMDLLIRGIEIEGYRVEQIMSKKDVVVLQDLTRKRFKALKNNTTILNKYLLALTSLKNVGIELSDRRKVKILKVVSAISIIYVEDRPSLNALADALRLCAVHTEDDREKVEQVILQNRITTHYEIIKQIQVLTTELKKALSDFRSKGSKVTKEDFQRLNALRKKVRRFIAQEVPADRRLLSYIQELEKYYAEVETLLEKEKMEFGFDE